MGTINLADLQDDSFVVHFGGRLGEIDAVTFGNALVAMAETLQAINDTINPGHGLEVRIEETGTGSFRARLKAVSRPLKSIFSQSRMENLVLGVLSAIIYSQLFDDRPTISVTADDVVIERGRDRIIVPRKTFDAAKAAEKNPAVRRGIDKTIAAVERDPAITDIGLTPKLTDPEPLVIIDRRDFASIRQRMSPDELLSETERYSDEAVLLVIHKAVLERSKRKWEFIWKGFRLSAPIMDESFFDRLADRKVSIMQGDTFEATLRVHQIRDEISGAWINTRYEVMRLGDKVGVPPFQPSFDN